MTCPQSASYLLRENLETFPLLSRAGQGCPLSLLFNIELQVLVGPLHKKKKPKGYKWERRKSNEFLFSDVMMGSLHKRTKT